MTFFLLGFFVGISLLKSYQWYRHRRVHAKVFCYPKKPEQNWRKGGEE